MKIAAIVMALAISTYAHADSRLQYEPYDKHRVYTVYARVGKSTVIQFQDGEYIDPTKTDKSVLAIGYGDAWQLGVRQNNFALKPQKDQPDTNMVIVTNKRTYAFDLKIAKTLKTSTTYLLSFTYPDDERAEAAARRAEIQQAIAAADAERVMREAAIARDREITASARAKQIKLNTDYFYRGDSRDLVPTGAWDNGRFTYLEYNHSGALPQFYKVMPDGTEALINTGVNTDPNRHNQIILQEVNRVIRARLGNEVIEIVNHSYTLPDFNESGTSEHGAVRIENKVEGVE